MILGIDCGKTGALALLEPDGTLRDVHDMPLAGGDIAPVLIIDWLDDTATDIQLATVERLHAMPPPVGSKANFSKGRSFGLVLGVLAGLRIPVELPTAAAWKRTMGVSKDKDGCRALALDMWPADSALFARKKDADRAEAALIAEYGRRLLFERGAA